MSVFHNFSTKSSLCVFLTNRSVNVDRRQVLDAFKSFGQNLQLFKKLKVLLDILTFTHKTFRVFIHFELTVKVF